MATVKVWETFDAGAYMAFPACDAWIVQVPLVTRVIALPPTVQTAVVIEENVTGRPDEALATNVGGVVPMTWFGIGRKLIVWLARVPVLTTCEKGALLELLLAASPA